LVSGWEFDYPDRIGALILACSTAGISHGVRPSEETRAIMASRVTVQIYEIDVLENLGVETSFNFLYSVSESVKNPMPAYAEELHALASRGT